MKRTYDIEIQTPERAYFYIGLAHTKTKGYRIIKVGTTARIQERAQEHKRHHYSKSEFSLTDFEYLQVIELSRSTAEALENSVRNYFKKLQNDDEIFIRNDRYVIIHNDEIEINISITKRKVHKIVIPAI